jgi:hypothetical protein
MTYALRETCSLAAHALATQMAPIIALTALAPLGLSVAPFHEPFHAQKRRVRLSWCRGNRAILNTYGVRLVVSGLFICT